MKQNKPHNTDAKVLVKVKILGQMVVFYFYEEQIQGVLQKWLFHSFQQWTNMSSGI